MQGIGIEDTLEEIVRRVPAPQNTADKPLRALIFDSHYDSYKVPLLQPTVVMLCWDAQITHQSSLKCDLDLKRSNIN